MATATETYRYSKLRVRHFDVEVDAVIVGRSVYFPVKALCRAVGGLAPQPQIDRLRDDGRTAPHLRPIPCPTIKGLRETICLRRQEVSIWLANIDIPRTALKDKTRLAEFQAELFAAADRFLMGDTSDVVMDGPTTTRPISGKIFAGTCPRCGLDLCLEIGPDGNHLRPADDDEEEE